MWNITMQVSSDISKFSIVKNKTTKPIVGPIEGFKAQHKHR